MDNSMAWNYTPNSNATCISIFIPKYTLLKLEITKVCVITDKSKFRIIYNIASCRLRSLLCICHSVSDHKQWRIMMVTVSDLLKDTEKRKVFKAFLSSSFSVIFSISQLAVFIQTAES